MRRENRHTHPTTPENPLPPRPTVIVLNGPGSVGKSSVARALQTIAARPFLHVALDRFLAMVPPALFGRPEGLVFEPVEEEGRPCLAVRTGPVVARALAGMRHAVAAMAGQGNDLIVDEVMIWEAKDQAYRALLPGCAVRCVGLFAPLEVLEARERARGDREIGLARWQHRRVHEGVTYDLTIDTSRATPEDCARAIRDAFAL